MAKKSLIAKAKREPKFAVRGYNRCHICGRPRAYLRNSACAAFAFVIWPMREKYRELKKPAGR